MGKRHLANVDEKYTIYTVYTVIATKLNAAAAAILPTDRQTDTNA